MTDNAPAVQTISLQEWQGDIQESYWFVLAESVSNPNVRFLSSSVLPEQENRLFWGNTGQTHASLSPYLFPFESWPWFESEISQASGWGMAVLLDDKYQTLPVKKQMEHLLQHLRAWTLVELPDKQQTLLRISDWEIFRILWQASDQQHRMLLKGPIKKVAYWQPQQQQVQILELITEPSDSRPGYQSPQPLTDRQFRALTIHSERHTYRQYRDHLYLHHPETANWLEEELNQYLFNQVGQANGLGFSQPREVIKFLSLSMMFGSDFSGQAWARSVMESNQYIGAQNRIDRLFEEGMKVLAKLQA